MAEKKATKRPSALKRTIQSKKKRLRSKAHKACVRTAIRSLKEALSKKEGSELLQEKLNAVYSLMDKGVKKGVYKANKAARTKARLALSLNQS